MNNIITITEAQTLARPIGKVDEAKLRNIITEAEDLFIRPLIGDDLFIELIADEVDEKYDILLNGGIYETNGKKQILRGLKTAIAYYVYGKNAMTGDAQSTRFGLVNKTGDFSTKVSGSERSSVYNEAFEIANKYFNDCLDYIKEQGFAPERSNKAKRASAGGITIRKI